MLLCLLREIKNCLESGGPTAVVLGEPMASQLGVNKGDVVRLFVITKNGVRSIRAGVCAFASVGFYEYDKHLVWLSKSDLPDIVGPVSSGAKIHMPESSLEFLNMEQTELTGALGNDYYAFTWHDRNENLFEREGNAQAMV